jgi:antirestriction protein ArdC
MRPTNRQSIYDDITAKVIEALESGVENWQKPWRASAPINAVTKRPYHGINVLLLGITLVSADTPPVVG